MALQKRMRTWHDDWFKRALRLWLNAMGDVHLDESIAGERRRCEVHFVERRRTQVRAATEHRCPCTEPKTGRPDLQ
jgi:hypothetical protein